MARRGGFHPPVTNRWQCSINQQYRSWTISFAICVLSSFLTTCNLGIERWSNFLSPGLHDMINYHYCMWDKRGNDNCCLWPYKSATSLFPNFCILNQSSPYHINSTSEICQFSFWKIATVEDFVTQPVTPSSAFYLTYADQLLSKQESR